MEFPHQTLPAYSRFSKLHRVFQSGTRMEITPLHSTLDLPEPTKIENGRKIIKMSYLPFDMYMRVEDNSRNPSEALPQNLGRSILEKSAGLFYYLSELLGFSESEVMTPSPLVRPSLNTNRVPGRSISG